MIDALYQKDVMRLAASAKGAGKLPHPTATVTVDNPLCGDRVTFDVVMDADKRIRELAHTVKGCVLCQASASVLGAAAAGETAESLNAARDTLRAMLKAGAAAPTDGKWTALAAFAPVAGHKSRHECLLLPFEAVIQAAKK
jgi:nitrogen fixation NifU-like protein